MIIEGQESVTAAVRQAMAATPDPRLRQVMDALIRHAHAFVREVRPTEEEFEFGLDFLAAIGKACTDTHNEAVLLLRRARRLHPGLPAQQRPGRRHGDRRRPARPVLARQLARDARRRLHPARPDARARRSSPTAACAGPDGAPIAGARVDVWQASPDGLYENQDPAQADMNLRGRFTTDAEGRFRFRSVRPAGYPVPTDGPAGDLLRAQRRHPYRPAHLHFLVHKPGFKTLVTQVFVDEDEHLETDVVFGVTRALVGGFERHDGPAPDGTEGEWYSLGYAFTLEPGEARLPRPPIA